MKGFNTMTIKFSKHFFNGALLAGALSMISTESALAQPTQVHRILLYVWFRRGIKPSEE
jgi:hypothetical protein